uniref:(northern house mosquito) hypothetical protein n=1 Tax=Culex pipiens TaxID=7175 RepID=A0A8D8NGN1_CULPI
MATGARTSSPPPNGLGNPPPAKLHAAHHPHRNHQGNPIHRPRHHGNHRTARTPRRIPPPHRLPPARGRQPRNHRPPLQNVRVPPPGQHRPPPKLRTPQPRHLIPLLEDLDHPAPNLRPQPRHVRLLLLGTIPNAPHPHGDVHHQSNRPHKTL